MDNTMTFQSGRYYLNADYRIAHYIDTEVMDIERHYHEFYECIFFLSGDVAYWVGSRCYYLSPGDVLLINAAQIHVPKMQSAIPPYDRISLFLDKGYVNSLSDGETEFVALFERGDSVLLHLPDEEFWAAKAIISKLQNCYANPPSFGRQLLSRCYITELLICFGQNLLQGAGDDLSPTPNSRIHMIKDYVAMNLKNELSLDILSKEFHLSKYYLAHEFKKHTGMSPYSYIIKRRLVKAGELLRSGYPGKEVCSQCGFNDIDVFNRAFKKEFGLTPRQYCRSMKEE